MVHDWDFNSYFSIHNICATEERLSCKTEQILPNLGFLCPDSDGPDILPGTKVELPYWLVSELKKSRVPVITFEMPKIYREYYRDILKADARAVELRKWNHYYYELGLLFHRTGVELESKIPEFLAEVFKKRLELLIETSSLTSDDSCDSVLNFTVLEKMLHLRSQKTQTELSKWLNFNTKNIEASSVIHNIRKRKQIEF